MKETEYLLIVAEKNVVRSIYFKAKIEDTHKKSK